MSKPGKRLALLLSLLGGAFQLFCAPSILPRGAGVSTTAKLADGLGEPPKVGSAPPTGLPPAAPFQPGQAAAFTAAELGGYATPVEDSLPPPGEDPAKAVVAPVTSPGSEPIVPALPPLRRRRTCTVWMRVTAYCPCRRCCGRYTDGMTASGHRIHANGSMFVAADTRMLPFGTEVSVPGYHRGRPVPVLDRGRRIRGNRLDVFLLSHESAKRWGARWLPVTVYLD